MIMNITHKAKLILKSTFPRQYVSLKALRRAYSTYKTVIDTEKKADSLVPEEKITRDPPQNVMDLKREYCCGCASCMNACAANAIKMVQDEEGFFVPSIDERKCVHCTRCVKACPVIHMPTANMDKPECLAAMADDAIRRDSSSGGIFTLLAEEVLEKGGFVCGVVLDNTFSAVHRVVASHEQFLAMRGSKYVQSEVGLVYREISKLLKDCDKPVLFSGTPCQAAALRNYLGKDYPNLYIIDIVCHGAPSKQLFHRYLEETYGDELKSFSFRTKQSGYNSMNQIATLKDGTELIRSFGFDAYEQCMHSGLSAKAICGNCPFAPAPRQGDLTIGDFWGIAQYNRSLNDGLGMSVVLQNNAKGRQLWDAVKGRCKRIEQVPFSFIQKHNRFGSKMRLPERRDDFYRMLRTQSFEKSVDYALNNHYDVGVIGLWYGRNYGSIATYFALHYVLSQMGLSVLMVENSLADPDERSEEPNHPYHVVKDIYNISPQFKLDELYTLNSMCDSFLVGSDQLWNVKLSRPYKRTYFLDFVDSTHKRISYGTSFGRPYTGTWGEKETLIRDLRKFDHVSVRDGLSESICRSFGIEAAQVCDPTFLCPQEEYRALAEKVHIQEDGKYLLAYILDADDSCMRLLQEVSRQSMKKVILILDMSRIEAERSLKKIHLDNYPDVLLRDNIDFRQWMRYYTDADGIITDSFHGTVFSIIFHKPFITKSNANRGAERFVSLLEPIGLEDHLFSDFDEMRGAFDLLKDDVIKYQAVEEKLNAIRNYSYSWLKNALFSPKRIENDPHCIYPYTMNVTEDVHNS